MWSQEKVLGIIHKIEGDAMGMKPTPFGGVLFDKNNPNKVFIATNANYVDGKIMRGDVIRDNNKKIIGFKNWTYHSDAPYIDSQFAFLPNNNIIYLNFTQKKAEYPYKKASGSNNRVQFGYDNIIYYSERPLEERPNVTGIGGGIIKNPPWHPKPNNYTDYAWLGKRISDVSLGTLKNNAYDLNETSLTTDSDLTDIEGIIYVRGDAIPEIKNHPERNGRDIIITGSYFQGFIKYGFLNADGTLEDPSKYRHIYLKSDPSEKEIVRDLNGFTLDPVSGHLVGSTWYPKNIFSPFIWTMDIGIQTACNQNVSVSNTTLTNTCPTETVNLNSLIINSTLAGASLVWSTDGDPNDGVSNTISNPNAISESGDYFAYYKSDSCGYSKPTKVTVTISSCLDTDGDGV
ncbi:MAG: hypothetical protein OIF50_08070, partial [Flavobacteriaceae bacterium]|nr:hypothetical protein [Flavobacteriaceae bacterium]